MSSPPVVAQAESHVRCPWCGARLRRMRPVGGEWTPWMCWTRVCWQRLSSWAVTVNKATRKGVKTDEIARWLFCPVPRQVEFLERARVLRRRWSVEHPDSTERPATRILYGGQAGASKSHGLRWALYRECLTHRHMNCLILRRTFKQLKDTHLRQMEREQHVLGARYLSADKEMHFPETESLIVAGHCETDADAAQYLSTDYDRILFDELVTFECEPAQEIMSRARTPMTKESIYEDGGAQVWGGTNPGGKGALWVKEFFIDKVVDTEKYPKYMPELYDFVPASLDDNPYLDPGYKLSLMQLSEIRRRQLMEGDWTAWEGQFFDWRATKDGSPWHVMEIPLD